MSLYHMLQLLTVARQNLGSSSTADTDMKLYMTLDCMLDVMDALVDRQLVTSEDTQ